jgi:hypothetical protein
MANVELAKKHRTWSRRDFLKAAGAAGVATLSGRALAAIPIVHTGPVSGAFDMRLQVGRGPFNRKADDIQLARRAHQAGMGGLVIETSDFPTADRAALVGQVVPEIAIFGGITTSPAVGGLNALAVQKMVRLSPDTAKVVWLPTRSPEYQHAPPGSIPSPVRLVDSSGRVPQEFLAIMNVVEKSDLVLAAGHRTPEELTAIAEAAKLCGARKLLVTYTPGSQEDYSLDDMKRCVEKGFFVECCCPVELSETSRHQQASDRAYTAARNCAEAIRSLGADSCILVSGLGSYPGRDPIQHLSDTVLALREEGVSSDEIDLMMNGNARFLLGLDKA